MTSPLPAGKGRPPGPLAGAGPRMRAGHHVLVARAQTISPGVGSTGTRMSVTRLRAGAGSGRGGVSAGGRGGGSEGVGFSSGDDEAPRRAAAAAAARARGVGTDAGGRGGCALPLGPPSAGAGRVRRRRWRLFAAGGAGEVVIGRECALSFSLSFNGAVCSATRRRVDLPCARTQGMGRAGARARARELRTASVWCSASSLSVNGRTSALSLSDGGESGLLLLPVVRCSRGRCVVGRRSEGLCRRRPTQSAADPAHALFPSFLSLPALRGASTTHNKGSNSTPPPTLQPTATMASTPPPPPPPSSSSSSSPSSPSSPLASLPAPVWGPALSIAALVLANALALLLNPGLFRACCRFRRRHAADTQSDPEAQQRRARRPSPPLSPSAAAPIPPRRCRCAPLPFFASNVDREGRRKSSLPLPPLPSELWGFDVLSPLDPLSSWLSPRSVRERVAAAVGAAGASEAWRPATWVLLPLHVFTFLYFVAYVLAETLWS